MIGLERTAEAARAWLLTAAVVLFGIAVVAVDLDLGTWLVISASGLVLAAVFFAEHLAGVLTSRTLPLLMLTGVLVGVLSLVLQPMVDGPWFTTAVLVLGVGSVAALVSNRRRRAILAFVVAGHFGLMSWGLAHLGEPPSDVFLFQQEAAAALSSGANPYEITYENPSEPGSMYYAPELEEADRLAFGFVYPPVSLLLALPGYLIVGDYRFAAVAAISATALLIGWTRPTSIAAGAALLVVFSPAVPRMVFWGWSEAFVAVTVALFGSFAVRRNVGGAIGLGMMLAVKQYMLPAVLVGLARAREMVRLPRTTAAFLAAGVGVVTVLPFAVWNFGALLHSTIEVHLLQPFRADSLSVAALIVRAGWGELPAFIAFSLTGASLAAVLLWGSRTVSGVLAGSMLVLIVLFIFGKQAHLNYFYLVLAGLAAAIGATLPSEKDGVVEPRAGSHRPGAT